MINRPSPFDEKELDHLKQPAAAVPPPLQPLLSTKPPQVRIRIFYLVWVTGYTTQSKARTLLGILFRF